MARRRRRFESQRQRQPERTHPAGQPDRRVARQRQDAAQPQLVALRQVHPPELRARGRRCCRRRWSAARAARRLDRDVSTRDVASDSAAAVGAQLSHLLRDARRCLGRAARPVARAYQRTVGLQRAEPFRLRERASASGRSMLRRAHAWAQVPRRAVRAAGEPARVPRGRATPG